MTTHIARRSLLLGTGAGLLAGALPIHIARGQDGQVTLRRGNGSEPGSLDPHKASGEWENNIIGDLHMGLYTEGPDAEPIPGGATGHAVSDDGLVWTFSLRPDWKWSDGSAVTAEDFVFAYRRILDPAFAAKYASLLYLIKGATEANAGRLPLEQVGVRAIDAQTLEITLEKPAPFLPQVLTHYTYFAVPRAQVAELGDGWARPGTMLCNGPFVVTEWLPRQRITAVKNPHFWDAANVKIDRVVYEPTEDVESAVRRFRAGELDTNTGWPTAMGEQLTREIPEEARRVPGIAIRYTVFNTERPGLNDARVRRALGMALDQERINQRVLRGFAGLTAHAIVPPLTANYAGGPRVEWADWPMERRREEAKALLEAAGVSPANKLRFEHLYLDSADSRRVASAAQEMWRPLGVEIEISTGEARVIYDRLRAGDFASAAVGWIADYNDAYNFLFLWETSNIGQLNYARYTNPEYDAAIQTAVRLADLDARRQGLQAAEAILLRDVPFLPEAVSLRRNLVSRRVQGWVDNPRNVYRSRWLSLAT